MSLKARGSNEVLKDDGGGGGGGGDGGGIKLTDLFWHFVY